MPEVCRTSGSSSASPQHLGPLLLRPAVSEPRFQANCNHQQTNSDGLEGFIRNPFQLNMVV